MKLFGGSRQAGHSAKGTRIGKKTARSGKRKAMPGWIRMILIIVLAVVLMIAAVFTAIRSISKPPERPGTQDELPSGNERIPVFDLEQDDPQGDSSDSGEQQNTDEEETIQTMTPTEQPNSYRDGVYNILICGTDGDGYRTDTIIVANLNANDHTVSLLSVPRDTLIYGNYAVPKINSSYSVGGISGLKSQLTSLLGFTVDGYVVVDLDAFVRIVDLVGGVEFDVPQNMYYNDPAQDLYINLSKGVQLLDGEHAMQLVRYRSYAAADLQRISVQQDFLKALAKKCVSIGSLTKLSEYAQIVKDCVDTDLTLGNMVWFGEQLLQCDFDQMKAYTPSGENAWVNGASCYALYASSILKIVNESFNPYEQEITVYDISVRAAPAVQSTTSTATTTTQTSANNESETEPSDSENDTQSEQEDDNSAPPEGFIMPGTSGTDQRTQTEMNDFGEATLP